MDQPKLERMLRLMKYLSGSVDYGIAELGRKLEMSPRTVYRYLDTFKSAGFAVTKLYGDVYKLGKMPRGTVELDRLIYFSEEEAFLVNSLIDQLVPSNSLKYNLKQKLSAIYRYTGIAEFSGRKNNAALVERLGTAVQDGLQVLLRDYESGHSRSIRDRRIEPFAFTSDYADIWAFDLEDGRNKTFKISRIGDVEVLDAAWEHEAEHRRAETDIFRMSGREPVRIVLSMTLKAKNLLVEEYPMASRFIRENEGSWLLDTEVYALEGAGRFVLGLMDDVRIEEGEALRSYVAEYAKRNFRGPASGL